MIIETKITSSEFNFHVKRARWDGKSLAKIYSYCLGVIKIHLNCKFGPKLFDKNIPHDIITKVIIEYPPKRFINNPAAWLCRIADNYVISMLKLKDNQTVELTENYAYDFVYESGIDFTEEELMKAWDRLDEESRYIMYLHTCLDYKLNEIAVILDKSPEYVRTKKSRAKKFLKQSVKESDKNCRF